MGSANAATPWHNRAVEAINKFIARDDGHQEVVLYAYIADAIGRTYGGQTPACRPT